MKELSMNHSFLKTDKKKTIILRSIVPDYLGI